MSESKYKQLIESIELNKIELTTLVCRQNETFETEKTTNLDIALRSDIKTTKFEGVELQIQIEFEVVAFNNSSDKKQEIKDIPEADTLFNIEFVLSLKYYLELDEVDDILVEFDDEINTFAEKNVPINAWPYARETISSITTRMGFPALVIPTYKNLPPS